MTETLTPYQVDSIPLADLPKRYGIGRTQFYERRDRLGLKFESRGNRSFASQEQVDLLDALHDHIKQGNTIDSFVESLGEQTSEQSGQIEIASNSTAALLTLAEIIASRIPQHQFDPLAHIGALQRACDQGWLLSSSELASLLKLARVSGQEIRRYGFVCTRTGRNGAESAWKITKG